jgi:hypothetical protein
MNVKGCACLDGENDIIPIIVHIQQLVWRFNIFAAWSYEELRLRDGQKVGPGFL